MATRDIVPRADGEGEIGTTEKMWLGGHFKTVYTNRIENEGSGDTPDYCLSSYTSWAAAVAAIGSTAARLIVDTDATVSADSTVPSTLMVKVCPGCIITVATTKTLTINGPFEAGLYQVFSCTGTGAVSFGGMCPNGYFEWWGASHSASAAVNAPAMQSAIDSGVPLIITPGTFSYDTSLILKSNTSISGVNKVTSWLQYTGTSHGIKGVSGTRLFRILLEKFTLTTNNNSNVGDGVRLEEYDSYCRIEELNIDYFGRGGILLTGLQNVVKKCNVVGRSLANGGALYGIKVQKSTTTLTRPTTILLDHNYISAINYAGDIGVGLHWEWGYQCEDTYNIVESSDYGRYMDSCSMQVEIGTYYEANTVNQSWVDTTGSVIGREDPNQYATWSAVAADSRYIKFISTLHQVSRTWSTAGDLLYGDGSVVGLPTRLAAGAANLKLFMNAAGTAPEWAAGVSGINLTRDMTATGAPTNVSYTGAGFKPSLVVFLYAITGTAVIGHGFMTASYQGRSEQAYDGTVEVGTGNCIRLLPAGGAAQTAAYVSLDADGFTLSWTKTGSPTGTASIIALCFR